MFGHREAEDREAMIDGPNRRYGLMRRTALKILRALLRAIESEMDRRNSRGVDHG